MKYVKKYFSSICRRWSAGRVDEAWSELVDGPSESTRIVAEPRGTDPAILRAFPEVQTLTI